MMSVGTTARYRPSGLKLTSKTSPPCCTRATSAPVAASTTRAIFSSLAVAQIPPIGAEAHGTNQASVLNPGHLPGVAQVPRALRIDRPVAWQML